MTLSGSDLMRTWFREVWDEKRADAIDTHAAPHWRGNGVELPGGPELSWRDRFKLLHRDFVAAFPDITITVDRTVSEADFVTAACTIRGTHLGDALGFPATGRKVEVGGLAMVRTEGGKIVESWESWNFLDLYKQLGVSPA
jgi:predicted ester cyclase